ncbi:MAG: tetratricopeptide repeat protein [Nitrospirae bacterium]|nr:tetratricopeptide repeat protein [Candidatus Troglogloeales bacterium]
MKYLISFVIFVLLSLSFSGLLREASAFSPTPSPETYYHTLLGLQYETDGEYEKALTEYQKAKSRDENAHFLLTRIAISAARVGNLEEAIGFAEKANKVKPHDLSTLNLLADLYAAGDTSENAAAIYNEIIAQAPKEIDGYLNLAEFLAREKNLGGAIETVSRGLTANPSSHLGHYYLGKLFANQKEYEMAIKHYQEAILLYPAFLQAYLSSASLYELSGKMDEAENIYRHILEEDSMEHEEAGLRLTYLLTEKKSFSEAMDTLNFLSEENPKNPDIWLKISLLWAQQKEYKKALEVLEKVMAVSPSSREMKSYLASLYEGVGEYEEAVKTYHEVIQKEGDSYYIHLRLGGLYFYRLKKVEVALAEGENARKIDPKKHEAYLFMGLVLYESGRYEEAMASFLKGIEMAPAQADLHFHLGATYDKLDRFDALVDEMQKAIAIDSKHAMALNYLGYTYVERGVHLDEAISLINRALAIKPDDGYVVDSLGWAYYKQGKVKEALAALERAVVLVPDDPVILEHLGEVYLKENQMDQSRKAWARSLEIDPKNEQLKTRFKEAGFLSPEESSLQNILDVNPPPVVPSS